MILFVGLNDWMIRNLLKSTFTNAAKESILEFGGLVYENSYEAYNGLLKTDLRMKAFPMSLVNLSKANDVNTLDKRKFDVVGNIRKYKKKSKTIYYYNLGCNSNPKNIRRHKGLKFIATTLGFTNIDWYMFKSAMKNYANSSYVQNECIPFLKKNKVQLIVSCSPETPYDLPWMLAAEELNIKRIIWIRSWDNITSKISFMPAANMVVVWSDLMKEEFNYFFPEYKNTVVEKIGSLQFDQHHDQSNVIPYEQFCELTGIDKQKKFVLYTTGGPHICPDEHILIKQVDDLFNQNEELRSKYDLLIRLHPYTWNTSFDDSFNYKYAKMWPPKNRRNFYKGERTDILFSDYQIMISSFYHQSLNLNIASTVTIDSCIYDKPVLNIAYDPVTVANKSQSITRYYEHYDHYIPLVKSGGVDLVNSHSELEEKVIFNLKYPESRTFGRKKIVEMECGKIDGQAGERLYCSIEKCLKL